MISKGGIDVSTDLLRFSVYHCLHRKCSLEEFTSVMMSTLGVPGRNQWQQPYRTFPEVA